MRTIWEWFGSLFNGGADVNVVKIEGKQTKEAKKRAKRIKSSREAKEEHQRTGNKRSKLDNYEE